MLTIALMVVPMIAKGYSMHDQLYFLLFVVEDMHRMNRALQQERMKIEEEFRKQLVRFFEFILYCFLVVNI